MAGRDDEADWMEENVRSRPTGRPPGPAAADGPKRVLIVEDEDAVGRATSRVLSRAGYACELAHDGPAAIASLVAGQFDVVVSDVRMPGMSGLDLLRLIRKYQLDVPVIFLTAHPDGHAEASASELGAIRYLTKPADSTTLLAAVSRAAALSQIAAAKREAEVFSGPDHAPGDRVGLGVALDEALEQLSIACQPIVDFPGRRVFGYEALMRTTDAHLRTPSAVLDAAERLQRTSDVGRRVRGLVAERLAFAPPDVTMFINLHPLDLLDGQLSSGMDPLAPYASRVVCELTERSRLGDLDDARERVAALKRAGFRVAIDDIGSGYSGLSSFALLEPELVKIDMSLIRDVHASNTKQRVVKNLGVLCAELAIDVIAEGIETSAERDCLLDLGLGLFQGYLFGRPGPGFPDAVL